MSKWGKSPDRPTNNLTADGIHLPALVSGLMFLAIWGIACQQLWTGNLWTVASTFETTQTENSLHLEQFSLVGEPITLPGISDNASGLTINPRHNTLILVNNNPEQLLEYSHHGELLRVIELVDFIDTEAIVHLYDDQFAIAEERTGTVSQITLNDQTARIYRHQSRLLATIDVIGTNHGIEGLAYHADRQTLYLVLEDEPAMLVEIPLDRTTREPVVIALNDITKPSEGVPGNLDDLSGLHFAVATNSLLMLSDESKTLVELDSNGNVTSQISLSWLNLGLGNSVPQAEGVTLDKDGNLYICSEPNLLYRFKNTHTAEHQPPLLAQLETPTP